MLDQHPASTQVKDIAQWLLIAKYVERLMSR